MKMWVEYTVCDKRLRDIIFQGQHCTAEQLSCVQNITVDTSVCLSSCSGLMVTGFSKLDVDRKMNDYIPDEIEAYKKYKNTLWGFLHGMSTFPIGMN